ncbi:hypothetical protein [Saccharopolyspora pogona]|uniref:hypothetical protein n=1 Tax=Saccharopolyspora pogona TaxID=333966 RepID=UPI001688CF9A|nr:hypothetical protein [Saccharopolyspora pogona]
MPGNIVGEVSIKVRPDTTEFSKELRAKLKAIKDDFQVKIGLDTAKARAEFQALKQRIESDDLNVRVNLKTTGLDIGNQLGSVRRATSEIVSELDRAKAAFEQSSVALEKAHKAEISSIARLRDAELKLWELRLKGLATASRTARAEAQIAVLRDDVAKASRRLAKAQEDNYHAMWRYFSVQRDSNKELSWFGSLVSTVRSAFSKLGSGVSSLFDPFKDVGKKVSEFGESLGEIGGPIIQAILGAARLSLIFASMGLVLTVVTTAIGVLIGAVGALIGGIASLAALGVGAFAAIALGMDGIKDAAKVLKPQIDGLKKTLNTTWREGLTPVFERLKSLFPSIETGLNNIAKRFVAFADGMSQFFTSVRGTAMLEQIFKNIDEATGSILGSVSGLVIELTRVAATKGIMDALASTINGVVEGITNFIKRAHEMGLIESSLTGVDQILRGILSFLEQVLIAGMEFLTNSAPGIKNFFEDWGALIDRVNWSAIGTAISDLFDRAGAAMERIPQDTLDKIVLGIEALANEIAKFLENGGMETLADLFYVALVAMVVFTAALNSLPPIVDLVKFAFDTLVTVINGIKAAFENVGASVNLIGQIMVGDWTGALETIKEISGAKMGETADVMKGKAQDAKNGVTGEIQSLKDQLGPLWFALPAPVQAAFNQMESAARDGARRTANEAGRMPAEAKKAMGDVGGALKGSGRSLVDGFISGMQGMISSVKSAARSIVSAARGFFPNSPAKEGPFSGKGYTTYSGRALATDFAKGIESRAHLAERAVENMMGVANQTANAEWNGHITSDGFGLTGSVADGVAAGLNGARLRFDGPNLAQIVNQTNTRNSRR